MSISLPREPNSEKYEEVIVTQSEILHQEQSSLIQHDENVLPNYEILQNNLHQNQLDEEYLLLQGK